jgi:hypothetical protein
MTNAERLGEFLKSLAKQEVTIEVQFELLRVIAADFAHRLDNIATKALSLPDLTPKDGIDEITFELAFVIEDPCGANELRLARAAVSLIRSVSSSHRAEMADSLEKLAERQKEFQDEPIEQTKS